MDPDWTENAEQQAYGRVRRIGQTASKVYSFRAICPEVELERKIVDRQDIHMWIRKQTDQKERPDACLSGQSYSTHELQDQGCC